MRHLPSYSAPVVQSNRLSAPRREPPGWSLVADVEQGWTLGHSSVDSTYMAKITKKYRKLVRDMGSL